jgi:hypothetical protein
MLGLSAFCRAAQEMLPPAAGLPVVGGSRQKTQEAEGVVIPFVDYDPPVQPSLIVLARINDGPRMRFLLDVSSDYGIHLFHTAAEKLGLLPTEKPGEAATPDAPRAIPPVTLTLLNRQGNEGSRIPVVNAWRQTIPSYIKEVYQREIAGIIGAQVILRGPCVLDFGRKEWTLLKTDTAGQYPLAGSNITSLPLRYTPSEGAPTLDGVLIPDGPALKWTLGTVSDSTLLPASVESLLTSKIHARRVRHVAGANGAEKWTEVLLSDLSLGQVHTSEIAVMLVPDLTEGRLGPDFLERFTLLLIPGKAGQAGEARFASRSEFTARLAGTTGITLEERPGNGFLVTAVAGPALPSSPQEPAASSRGVQVGDFVREIDGKRIDKASLWMATTLLDGYTGTTAQLLVETPGEPPRHVRIVRVNSFDSLARPGPRLTAPAIVPFEFDPIRSPYIIVRVRLNAGPSLPFIVDTGADCDLMLTTALAKTRKIVIGNGDITIAGLTGNTSGRFGYGAKAAFVGRAGDTTIDTVKTLVLPFPPKLFLKTAGGEPVAGTIGMRALTPYVVQFDFTRKEMRLYPPRSAPAPLPGDITLPLAPRSPEGALVSVRGGIPTATTDLTIDTGSPLTTAGRSSAMPAGTRIFAEPVARSGIGGQPSRLQPFLIPVFSLGVHQERNVFVVPDATEKWAHIGTDLLSRYDVTLDLPGFLMRLTRPADYAQRCRIPGTLDIVLGDRKHGATGWPVALAYRDGVAYKAGVRDGDTILSVDSVALRPNDDAVLVNSMLNGFAGTVATLTVRSSRGKIRTVRALREWNLIPSPDLRPTDPGFSFGYSTKGQLTLGEISPGFAARVALQTGDEILSVNSKSVRLYTLRGITAGFFAALESGGVIEYRRNGTTGRAVISPGPSKVSPNGRH